MTKTSILKQLKLWNSTKQIGQFFIRRRGWDHNQWQIVDSLNFDDCQIIESFYYQAELANYLKNNL